jgi:cardiolipin synthase C
MYEWFLDHKVIASLAMAVAALLAMGGATLTYGVRGQRDTGPDCFALPVHDDRTVLDRYVQPELRRNPGASGLRLVSNDLEAFRARLSLAGKAGRSLDLQYYYWKSDLTGRILGHALLGAADRGVRVRLLLDDINSMGLDPTYLALNAHPMIEVRLFNPSRIRTSPARRGLELVFRYFSATRRMHNKCWIADGRVAIVGGRNVGDAYFGAANGPNFHDLDVMAVGAAVKEAESIFDSYWNSAAALPITSLHRVRRGKLAKLRVNLARHCASRQAVAYLTYLGQRYPTEDMIRAKDIIWVQSANVIADPPEKAMAGGRDKWLSRHIVTLMGGAQKDLLLCSPYFIPGQEGMALLGKVSSLGVKIKVLTNSLAATDVMIVHSAYAKYRSKILSTGIALFEQKPSAGRRRISLFGSRTASLHTKAIVVDRAEGFVGSFNLDPRSASINTEMGILFRSEPLAASIANILEDQMHASYEVRERNGRLVWLDANQAGNAERAAEPDASVSRRWGSWLAGFLPIESQL